MNQKKYMRIMAVLFVAAVYILMYVWLPAYSQTGWAAQMEKGVAAGDNPTITAKKTVVLDSGHGGMDPGKKSNSGILEKDINLSIAQKLKELLEQEQISVVMTRTDDAGLYTDADSNKKIADMKKRCAIIDDCKADIVVSIHQNSFESEKIKGAQVFYYKHSAEGKRLAHILQESFKKHLDEDNKRVEKEDTTYYMLLHTSAPTVIAECGFLSNREEAALLNTQEYQQKVAKALCDGILEYFGDEKRGYDN